MRLGVSIGRRFGRAGLVLTTVLVILGSSDGGAAGQQQVAELLARAQSLLREGRTEAALDLLERASEATQEWAGLQLSLKEELLWQKAMANLDFVDEFSNEDQKRKIAARAQRQWREYLEWYGNLTPDELKNLPPKNNRIHKATAFLGMAGLRAGAWQAVLKDYKKIADVMYLGPDAIDNWKTALYMCPDGVEVANRTDDVRRRKVCEQSCTEHWLVYKATLAEWADVFKLRPAIREQSQREARQVEGLAAACQPGAPGGER